ncbi:MAG: hypothetical protein GTN89_00165 [Acidobacteria bacterium]|nr:hypothetical protein [Acidobacteriota bacterium]NIM60136.1 hypothetical protein [Acidobacteriota bacterium]NIO57805.1 hypothetical protein [Acidobacteriota bacterium]NIQ28814.1 hypothetical protein [Acidobacteriota bacterium]NIQ83272.1 hypothetical protein [Acidobacteriota bacterium]
MSSQRTPQERERLIEEHVDAIRRLESEGREEDTGGWPPQGFYLLWHLVVGITLGGLAALVSLGFNVVGAPLFGQPSMQLIRVYLTFPMGERALTAEEGLALSVGAGLYLITGAILGIGFHLVLRTFRPDGPTKMFLVATALGLGLWIVNFYLILSWLQPVLLGGRWIVDEIPFWVAALTHLAFAWTIWVGEYWGRFEPAGGRR